MTIVHPIAKDGSTDHSVCIIDDILFDARFPFALKLKKETFHFVCGDCGLEKLEKYIGFHNHGM
jgi:hypothetical protein